VRLEAILPRPSKVREENEDPFVRLVLFTRYPEPGKAKTRLIPAIGSEQAASVHRQLTENTVEVLQSALQGNPNSGPARGHLEIHVTGAANTRFVDWLGCLHFVQQVDGDLSQRLIQALSPAPVVFIGADTPELTATIVRSAMTALDNHQVVIGPAEDGGYYLIGVAHQYPELFTNMPWGTEDVFDETMRRIEAQKLSFSILPKLNDCDRPADLERWPWLVQ